MREDTVLMSITGKASHWPLAKSIGYLHMSGQSEILCPISPRYSLTFQRSHEGERREEAETSICEAGGSSNNAVISLLRCFRESFLGLRSQSPLKVTFLRPQIIRRNVSPSSFRTCRPHRSILLCSRLTRMHLEVDSPVYRHSTISGIHAKRP